MILVIYCSSFEYFQPLGAGAFRRAFTTNVAPQCRAFSRAMEIEKLKAPLFRGPEGGGDTTDWCIVCQAKCTISYKMDCVVPFRPCCQVHWAQRSFQPRQSYVHGFLGLTSTKLGINATCSRPPRTATWPGLEPVTLWSVIRDATPKCTGVKKIQYTLPYKL